MADKHSKRLVREVEPSQKTDKGLEIPVPSRDDFFGALKKAAKKSPAGKPSRPDQGKP